MHRFRWLVLAVWDATIVRGVLAPALVAALGSANWWWLFGRHQDR